ESAFGFPGIEKRHQALDVDFGRWSSIGPPCQRRQDLTSACRFFAGCFRPANENALAAWRVSRPRDVVRTADRYTGECGLRASAAHARAKRVFIPRLALFNEGHSDKSWTCLHRDAEFERLRTTAATPNRDQLQSFPIHRDFDLIACRAGQFELDVVIGVQREITANGQ